MIKEAYDAGKRSALEKIADKTPEVGEHWADYVGASVLGGSLGGLAKGPKGALIGSVGAPALLGGGKLLEQLRKRNKERRGEHDEGYRVFKPVKQRKD